MRSIVGTWRLVKAESFDAQGKPLPLPYGGKGMGRACFTEDGRMMAVTGSALKEMPPGAARDYSSYCGDYTFDGTQLVTHVDGASDPTRLGGDQVRKASFDGERLVLRPPPRPNGEQRVLTWEKISSE